MSIFHLLTLSSLLQNRVRNRKTGVLEWWSPFSPGLMITILSTQTDIPFTPSSISNLSIRHFDHLDLQSITSILNLSSSCSMLSPPCPGRATNFLTHFLTHNLLLLNWLVRLGRRDCQEGVAVGVRNHGGLNGVGEVVVKRIIFRTTTE